MRWMTIATVFAAASGYIVMMLAAAVLGTDGADRWLVFWSSFFAIAAVANGVLQEVTRAVGDAPTVRSDTSSDAELGSRSSTIAIRTAAFIGLSGALISLLTAVWWAPAIAPQVSLWASVSMALGVSGIFIQQGIAGLLSGTGRWNRYAMLLGVDALLRLLLALVLAADYFTVGIIPEIGYQVGFIVTTVIGTIAWTMILAGSSDRREFLHAPIDVSIPQFWRNCVAAMAATAATAMMVTGFPALVEISSRISPTHSAVPVAALLYCVMLTRAPLLVPLQAFQSAIIMYFLRRTDKPLPALAYPAAGLIVLGIIGAGLAWAIGPWIFGWFLDEAFILPGPQLGVFTAASVGTALLMVTGCSALAHQLHRTYTIGWWLAAASYALLLLLPLDLVTRAALAVSAGPLVGVLWHVVAVIRFQRHSQPAPSGIRIKSD